jgi:hypothetical protein
MLAGCAALKMEGVMFDLNSIVPPDAAAKNSQVATTIGEVKDAWGQNSRVSVTWQVQNGVWILVLLCHKLISSAVATMATGTPRQIV